MLAQIAQFLIETVGGFLVFALLARFHFQWLRVPFRNPLGEFVIAVTNWMVLPARRVIPPAGQIDLASIVVAWLVQFACLCAVVLALGGDPSIARLAVLAVVDLLRYSIYLLIGAVIVQAVMSWVNPHAPLAPAFDAFVRPFLRPIRRRLPPVGNIDLSPLVLLIVLQVLLFPVWYLRGLVAALP